MPSDVYALRRTLDKLAKPEDIAQINAMLRGSEFRCLLEERYLPSAYSLDQLADSPSGSLGKGYYDHMKRNGLEIDFFGEIECATDLDYVALRMSQIHDYWHVAFGYSTSNAGEAAAVGLSLAQLAKYCADAADALSSLVGIMFGTSLVRLSLHHNDQLKHWFRGFSDGYQRGAQAANLTEFKWEDNWATPITDVQHELEIPAPRLAPNDVIMTQLSPAEDCARPDR